MEITDGHFRHILHQKKVMLSLWWDFKGIVYLKLLPRNQTINSNVYCRQLIKLYIEIKEKRPERQTTYIFGHSQKIIGVRLRSDASSTV